MKFFHRGKSKDLRERLFSTCLDDSSANFADYLISKECRTLLRKNKISIHIETGNIFFENKNRIESIEDFFYTQQDYSKKLLKMKLIFSEDYEAYVSEYLMARKSTNDDKYNMLTKKNLEFLFFKDTLKGFNDFKNKQRKCMFFDIYSESVFNTLYIEIKRKC